MSLRFNPLSGKFELAGALLAANNLSDLADVAIARANLFGANFGWDGAAKKLTIGIGAIQDQGSGQLGIGGGSGTFCYVNANSVQSTGLNGFALGPFGNPDIYVTRDAADTVAQRRGANAQRLRVYAGYVDASNYSRGYIDAGAGASGVLAIGSESLGAGATAMDKFRLFINGVKRLDFNDTASSAFYFTNSLVTGGGFLMSGRGGMRPGSADGIILVNNNGAAGFDRLVLGLETALFPALKRSSTRVQARLADDSAFASIQGKITTDTAYVAGDPTTTGYLTIYDSAGVAYKVPAVAV